MPEDLNVEIAGGIAEAGSQQERAEKLRWERFVEISEAIVLAFVAVSTAWSGYQAARWDGRQAERYGTASAVRIQADEQLTLGGQQKLLDVSTFNTWIQAKEEGNDALAALYVRRFIAGTYASAGARAVGAIPTSSLRTTSDSASKAIPGSVCLFSFTQRNRDPMFSGCVLRQTFQKSSC